jgi:two-component system chemotaxis response regulator CheB
MASVHSPYGAGRAIDCIVIGGSAGSFSVVNRILASLPKTYSIPIIMCLHRLRDKKEGFKEALQLKSPLAVEEPNDKDPINYKHVYLAPANYHLLVEDRRSFALAITESVQYSRPSIDVLMESAADVFKDRLMGILLSGANKDGALGLKRIKDKGGFTVVQDPSECVMVTMPEAAIRATSVDVIAQSEEIGQVIRSFEKISG